MARTSTITKQDIINDVHRVAANHDGNIRMSYYLAEGAFSLGTIKKFFGGSTNETFAQILSISATDEAMDNSTVRMLAVKAIKDMGRAGIKTNTENFNRHARGINSKDVSAIYGSFAEGVREMGYEVDEVAPVKARKKRSDAKIAA